MKTRFIAGCLALSVAWFSSVKTAQGEEAQPENQTDWLKLAEERQSALLVCYWKDGKTGHGGGVAGFFISQEGHALCGIRAFCAPVAPEFGDWQRNLIPSWKLIGIIPEKNLAVLKLDHKPARWLELAERKIIKNEEVAFLVPMQFPPIHIGPIMAIYEDRTLHFPRPVFTTMMSIGTQPPRKTSPGGGNLSDGCPLIDSAGLVVGTYHGIIPTAPQTIVNALPCEDISKQVAAIIKNNKIIDVPLSEGNYPFDPAIGHQAYAELTFALRDGKKEAASKQLQVLVEAFPNSWNARALQVDMWYHCGGSEEGLAAVLRSISNARGSMVDDPYSALMIDANIAKQERDWDKAIAILKEAGKHSPEAYYEQAASIATCYDQKAAISKDRDSLVEAANWYEKALVVSPERMILLMNYESVLNRLGRWEDSSKISERIWEVERIYQMK